MAAKCRSFCLFLLCTLLVPVCETQARPASFRILGSRGGGMWPSSSTSVMGVSDDGTTAVGRYTYSPEVGRPQSHLRRWSVDGELLPTADIDASASDVSADGSVLVGTEYLWAAEGSSVQYEAFLWRSDGSLASLGHLPGGGSYSNASGVSADGSVVVGVSDCELGRAAFRWTQAGDMVELATLPGDTSSSAAAVSADGQIAVGSSNLDPSNSTAEAVRWTADGTVAGLGRLGDHLSSSAFDVSGDGSVIVGWSGTGMQGGSYPVAGVPGDQAFLWTEAQRMIGLGFLPDHGWSRATAVSADGRVVVGSSAALVANGEFTNVGLHEAFIWDAERGMRNLKDLLADKYGLDMPDWSLGSPTGISADGRVIVGNGGGLPVVSGGAWIAVIPEPSTMVLTVIGLLLLLARVWRKRRLV